MAACRTALIAIVFLLTAIVAWPISWLAPRAAMLMIRLGCRAMLWLLNIQVRVAGTPRTGLIVANHVSWIDAIAALAVQPVCFLAKHEVGTWPLVAQLARAHGTVFVNRQRRRCIPGVNAAMAERLQSGRAVLLFPEGTTFDGRQRGRFHTSHLACLRSLFAADATARTALAQPLSIAYSDQAAAWIGDDTLLPHIWRLMGRPPIVCELRFGEAIEVAPGYDRKALGRTIAEHIEALLALAPLGERPAATIPATLDERFGTAEAI